jgi:hypothetical protein
MGEMVERVKAAIKLNIENAQIGKDGRVFDKYELAAKAAIEALRVPTAAMRKAYNDESIVGYSPDPIDPDVTWKAGIDAALKE